MASAKSNHNGRKGTREANGRGSVYQRASDGLWCGSLMVGYKTTTNRAGQTVQNPDIRKVYGKTQAEALRKLDGLRRDACTGMLAEPHKLTVNDWLGQWLRDHVAMRVRPQTLPSYRQIVRLYLAPELGRHKLIDLRPQHAQRLYSDLQARGLSPRTIAYAHAILRAALKQAVRLGLVHRNVTEAATPPAQQRVEVRPPTPVELARLLDAAEAAHDPLRALWTLAVYAGCRPGELLGLQWQDVDIESGQVTIRQALVWPRRGRHEVERQQPAEKQAPPHWRLAPPKTAKSRRTVSIPPEALAALRAHRHRQLLDRLRLGPDYADSGLVFCTRIGTPLSPRNVVREFKAALMRADLPPTIRFYDLRHGSATALLAAGEHPKVVSERLGHSTITLTMDTYTHVLKQLDATAALRLQRVIRPAGGAN